MYTFPSKVTGSRIMLLCNVALGEVFYTNQSDTQITAPPDGYDSLHGVKSTENQTSFFKVNDSCLFAYHLILTLFTFK